MISIIFIIIAIIFDGIILNNINFLVNDLSIFTPLITLTTVILINKFYIKQTNKYLLLCFITGIIYDLLYTNLLFFNGILFLLIGIFTIYFNKNIGINYIKIILLVCFIIISYEFISAYTYILLGLVNITFDEIIYKIGHSLLLNLIYAEIGYLIIRLIPKKININ